MSVAIANNRIIGHKNHTPSDTVVVPKPYNDGFVVLTPGTAVITPIDTGSDDLTLTFVAGDVWYESVKFIKVASTATFMGLRLNTL